MGLSYPGARHQGRQRGSAAVCAGAGTYRQLIEALKPRAHVFTARSRCLVPGTEPRSLRDWEARIFSTTASSFPLEHPEECGRRILTFLDAQG